MGLPGPQLVLLFDPYPPPAAKLVQPSLGAADWLGLTQLTIIQSPGVYGRSAGKPHDSRAHHDEGASKHQRPAARTRRRWPPRLATQQPSSPGTHCPAAVDGVETCGEALPCELLAAPPLARSSPEALSA